MIPTNNTASDILCRDYVVAEQVFQGSETGIVNETVAHRVASDVPSKKETVMNVQDKIDAYNSAIASLTKDFADEVSRSYLELFKVINVASFVIQDFVDNVPPCSCHNDDCCLRCHLPEDLLKKANTWLLAYEVIQKKRKRGE